MSEATDDRQRLIITIVFNEKHTPATEGHLEQIARAHLAPKGIKFNNFEIEI